MSCYHPILGLPDYDLGKNENGKYTYKLVGAYSLEAKSLDPNAVSIPCGHCIGCRLDYSRSWADRMMLELDSCNRKALFITLTYNNEHLPPRYAEDDSVVGATLYKRDLQLFLKRLRKKYSEKTLRFYASGEYGSLGRPHYHVILFGLGMEDFPNEVKHFLKLNELGNPMYNIDPISEAWSVYSRVAVPGKKVDFLKGRSKKVLEPIGFAVVEEVSWQTCAYVARYVMKKVFSNENYFVDMYDLEPEFALMSRRPGIGAYYLEQHPDLFDVSGLCVSGVKDPIRIPRYFLKKLELTDKDRYDNLISERKKFADDRIFLKMLKTNRSYVEQLEIEENDKLLKVHALKRLL